MYASIYDPIHTALLCDTSGKLSEAEWQQMYNEVVRMMDGAIFSRQDFILIVLSKSDVERPNANWRRKFAELRNKNKDLPRALTVIVTSSLLLRGIMTAINWVVPSKPKERTIAVDTFEEGFAWLQSETKQPLDYLLGLHRALLAMSPKRASA